MCCIIIFIFTTDRVFERLRILILQPTIWEATDSTTVEVFWAGLMVFSQPLTGKLITVSDRSYICYCIIISLNKNKVK